MSVVYSDTLKTNRLQLVSDLVAGKTAAASTGGASAGSLVVGTSALSGATGVLVTFTLPTSPFTVSTPVAGTVIATLQGVTIAGTASATGVAAKAELRNNGGTVIASGLTVGTSGTDVVLDTTSINSAQTVNLISGVITAG